ncbi:TIM barrel protein [Phytohabitans rumicis]|uniref:C-deglycosylation enzyme beta subunit n=1 Tax=Phytohabitans rumicis TaxID=1076125 RepID=A0A6V8KZC1_9ACTN|nr:TIM barrel protein [Phytohabitans rumicis]GFJ87831.1 hypothetical protein Prum_014730 [Phytohabitans rumicis]
MIDAYTLDASATRHDDHGLIAWSIRLRLPWFRALPVSCIERAAVLVDGQAVADRDLLFRLDGQHRPLSDLHAMPTRYWSVDETLQIGVRGESLVPRAEAAVTVELTLRLPDSGGNGGDWSRRVACGAVRVSDPGHAPWPLGVCTFSLGAELRRGRSLRSCLQRIAAIGGYTGLELLGAQVVEGYPAPERRWLDRFARELHATGLEPVCYDAFLDPGRTTVAARDDAAIMALAEAELDIAAALGCSHVRLNVPPRRPLLDHLAVAAEQRDLTVLSELHAQTSADPGVEALLEHLNAMRSPHLGLILDLSCVMRALPPGFVRHMMAAGLPADAVRHIAESWSAGLPPPALPSATATAFAQRAYRLFHRSDTGWLPDVLPFTRIVHGKFFDMDGGREPSIPYGQVLTMLKRTRFDGYLMSEYEGHLWDGSPDTFAQLRGHQRMISELSNV